MPDGSCRRPRPHWLCSSESKKTFTGLGSVRNRRKYDERRGWGVRQTFARPRSKFLSGLTLGRGLEQDARAEPPARQGRALHARRVDALLQHDGAIGVVDADLGVLLVHVHANPTSRLASFAFAASTVKCCEAQATTCEWRPAASPHLSAGLLPRRRRAAHARRAGRHDSARPLGDGYGACPVRQVGARRSGWLDVTTAERQE
jgi:hypothetical protein